MGQLTTDSKRRGQLSVRGSNAWGKPWESLVSMMRKRIACNVLFWREVHVQQITLQLSFLEDSKTHLPSNLVLLHVLGAVFLNESVRQNRSSSLKRQITPLWPRLPFELEPLEKVAIQERYPRWTTWAVL